MRSPPVAKKPVPEKVERKPARSSLFSAKTEYACVALLELALHHNDPTPLRLKAISEKHDISHRFLVQILLQLKTAGLVASTSEAFRAIEQGGVKLDGEKVGDKGLKLNPGAVVVAQVGKRKFARVTLI